MGRKREDLIKIGKATQFQPGKHPKGGRPVNRFKKLKGQFKLSADDVNSIIEYLLSLTKEELKKIIENPKSPMLIISYASAVMNGIKRGDLHNLEMMLNRKIGKPKESLEVTGGIDIVYLDAQDKGL